MIKIYTPETLNTKDYNYTLSFQKEPKLMNLTHDQLKKAYIFTAHTKDNKIIFLSDTFTLTFRQYGPLPLAFKSYEATIDPKDYINLSNYLKNKDREPMDEQIIEHTLNDINTRKLPLMIDQQQAEKTAKKLTHMAEHIKSKIPDFNIIKFSTMSVKELLQVFDKETKSKL